ncbi:phosphotransferase [Cohnella phaseoli]|uniref:Ser/Thr protein kinase RdoA (MazF antagonist) n=1 Tax=Cohnella phaseoli TaxID=456490 RepID=A0A3D9KJZ4_9BACL|nr:phosphotransferase [Cohnella phaseoli]RED86502.1 Ser/Thr protein kinase RdoA (MazF antagonist) [Cohnella phaseoli]
MPTKSPDQILYEIAEELKLYYGLIVKNAEANDFGFANLKWKIDTDAGIFFVKQYNSERYTDELLSHVEVALGLQDRLNKEAGIPCPTILPHKGSYIQRTSSGERFMLTEFCHGHMVGPGEVNKDQMYHLGQVTGRMHRWLNEHAPLSLHLHWVPASKEKMLTQWLTNWHQAHSAGSDKYIAALELQRKIAEKIDLEMFQSCEEGWVHWDLFVDNILFHSNYVSAILDFDRMHFIYPEFDISRAILSGTILNNKINLESAKAFINGYRESAPLPVLKLVRSIKLTWWKESAWLNIKSEEFRTLRRFAEELMWVGSHWSMLEDIFND